MNKIVIWLDQKCRALEGREINGPLVECLLSDQSKFIGVNNQPNIFATV